MNTLREAVQEKISPAQIADALTDVGHVSDIELPPDIIGESTGIAIAQLLQAGALGAGIGQLPQAAAELLRERLAAEDECRLLQEARGGRDVCWLDEGNPEPLVTIRMATFNRCEALMDCTLPTLLDQTYDNIEIVVVGDCTDAQTVKAMSGIKDKRVRFFNLPRPSSYPSDPIARWRVAGSPPMNLAAELALGAWITHCDDGDQFTSDHVEVLMRAAIERRLEMVYSKTLMETPIGWQVVGTRPLASGNFTAGSVMWSAGLRFLKMSTTCFKLNEPQDANLWRRMAQIGVKTGFVDDITYRYVQSSVFSAFDEARMLDEQKGANEEVLV